MGRCVFILLGCRPIGQPYCDYHHHVQLHRLFSGVLFYEPAWIFGGQKAAATRPPIPVDFQFPGLPIDNGKGSWFILLALLAVALIHWVLLYPPGLAIRTTGQNHNAAIYAGLSPKRITVIALVFQGRWRV